MKKLIASAIITSLLIANTAFAHPGRTDSNGGHTCRTNCEKWGYEYGEYHYHSKKVKKAKTEAKSSSKKSAKDKVEK